MPPIPAAPSVLELPPTAARNVLSFDPRVARYRKKAAILAVKLTTPFVVQTEHGSMGADAGDWLAMNDPEVDPTSDAWPISAERFESTYVLDVPGSSTALEPQRGITQLLEDALERAARQSNAAQGAVETMEWARAAAAIGAALEVVRFGRSS